MFGNGFMTLRKVTHDDLNNLFDLKQESWETTHHHAIINMLDQELWFKTIDNHPHSPRYMVLIAEVDQNPVGVFIASIDWVNRNADVSWSIYKDFRGKGLGKLLVSLASKFCLEILNMNRLSCEILASNLSSMRCAVSCGFEKEGVRKKSVYKNGSHVDSIVMGLLGSCLQKESSMSQENLKDLVRSLALEIKPHGEFFTLKSGAQSKYYLDCRNLNLNPKGLKAVVMALHDRLGLLEFDAVGGPSIGADPIIGGLVFFTGLAPKPRYKGFLVRPTSKDHGKGGRIVGPLNPGDRCVIIEDVTTTGASALDACAEVEAFGCKVVHVFSIIDRLAGGKDAFNMRNIPFTPLFTIKDFDL